MKRLIVIMFVAFCFSVSGFILVTSTSVDLRCADTNWHRTDTLCMDGIHEKTDCEQGGPSQCTAKYCNEPGGGGFEVWPFGPMWY